MTDDEPDWKPSEPTKLELMTAAAFLNMGPEPSATALSVARRIHRDAQYRAHYLGRDLARELAYLSYQMMRG